MKQSRSKLHPVGTFAIAVFAVAGLAHFVLASALAGRSALQEQGRYRVEVLAQEEARPGKVIRATSHGMELASYTCSNDDAGVAVVSVKDANDEVSLSLVVDDAIDSAGERYATTAHPVGNIVFVTVQRGFPQSPPSVSVKLGVYINYQATKGPVATAAVPFTRLAAPQRLVAPPTGRQLSEAEQIARAEYFEDRKALTVKVAPQHHGVASILATSFSSSLRASASASGLRAVTRNMYDDRADAVKVRIDFTKPTSSECTLTYKNAKIIEISGHRVLWLPTTQDVGTIDGLKAVVQRYSDIAYKDVKLKHAQGNFFVRLQQPEGTGFSVHQPHLSLISISPSVAEMGLDWLQVGVDVLAFGEMVKQNGLTKGPLITDIPTLTLKMQLTKFSSTRSTTVVLPIHHVKSTHPAVPSV